jgi:hypothetical protein
MQYWHQSPLFVLLARRLKEILSKSGSILHFKRRDRQIAIFLQRPIHAAVRESGRCGQTS